MLVVFEASWGLYVFLVARLAGGCTGLCIHFGLDERQTTRRENNDRET